MMSKRTFTRHCKLKVIEPATTDRPKPNYGDCGGPSEQCVPPANRPTTGQTRA